MGEKRFLLVMDFELHKKLKTLAVETGGTVTGIIRNALADYDFSKETAKK